MRNETETLFPLDLPEREWVEFRADGFSVPVIGIIHRRSYPARCGMPLGGIDTGCLDLETSGLFGLCSIFNSHVPRRGALNLPFLGLSVGGQTWVLTTGKQSREIGSRRARPDDPRLKNIVPKEIDPQLPDLVLPGVRLARDIHYWGHYPVADLEFETDAPVSVGLRAWTPFLPGDVEHSILPGAVFEVHLRNVSGEPQSGTLAFSFFGPTAGEEAGSDRFEREALESPVRGISVTASRSSYVLGVIGEQAARTGGELGLDGGAWARIAESLPPTTKSKPGASVAVDFTLARGAGETIRFVLAWCSPHWMSTGNPMLGPRAFRHMYTTRYPDALEAARVLAQEHETLLRRVLAWQQEIFTDQTLPGWLREVLVNVLHSYTEVTLWATAEPPIGEWCRPEDGLFASCESPRQCPQMECLPVSFFGNIPVAYFFPQMAISTLRGQKAYQSENGAPPLIFGGLGSWTGGCEMASPTPGYQATLNTPCYVTLVDRYWLLHGNNDFLREFYPSVKKSIEFMVDLNHGPDGIISMPDRFVSINEFIWYETEWYELYYWAGMVPHVGGLHLATLRMAERMARAMGDEEFAERCHKWIQAGSESLENKTWLGEYYLRYWDPHNGERCDDIFAPQLDGEWLARLHGLEGVFHPERVATVLETIKHTCVAATRLGTVHITTPEGTPTSESKDLTGLLADWLGTYHATTVFTCAPISLGLAYMYAEQVEFGLEVIRRTMRNHACEQGLTWYGANGFDCRTGEFLGGTEYAMNTVVWAVLGAMEGKDLTAPSQPGGPVDRIIRAATGKEATIAAQ